MRRIRYLPFLPLSLLLLAASSCPPSAPPGCDSFVGYGLYRLTPCDTVVIEGVEYELTGAEGLFTLGGRDLIPGIHREGDPWLYVHWLTASYIDVTFERRNSKSELYPLYAGSEGTLFFDGQDHTDKWWPTDRWSVVMLDNQVHWLVISHWSRDGLHLDLQKRHDATSWERLKEIVVPADGTAVGIFGPPVVRLNPDTFIWERGKEYAEVWFSAGP